MIDGALAEASIREREGMRPGITGATDGMRMIGVDGDDAVAGAEGFHE